MRGADITTRIAADVTTPTSASPYGAGVRAERPRRHSADLYDAVWDAELPPVMDEHDQRAAAVAEPVARLVLMAMAHFTNPSRDQNHGPAGQWRCWASVARIAEMANASERQVQRVLRAFERAGYIELLEQGRRPGRPRNGQTTAPARPNTWSLRPDRWRRRALKNYAGIVAISEEIPPVPAKNCAGTGDESLEKGTGTVTLTRKGLTRKEEPLARVCARETGSVDEETRRGHQVALHGFSATGLPPSLAPGQDSIEACVAATSDSTAPADALLVGLYRDGLASEPLRDSRELESAQELVHRGATPGDAAAWAREKVRDGRLEIITAATFLQAWAGWSERRRRESTPMRTPAYEHDPWHGQRPPIAEADLARGAAL